MYKSETTVRVRYGETDKMGVVYHANFIPYFELGRTDALRSMGLSYKQFEASGIIMPVIEVGIKYHKPAYYDDELIIITKITQMPSVKMHFEFEVYREDLLLVTGKVSLANLDAETRRPVRAPMQLVAFLRPFLG